jgi:hypothetical protein
MVKINEELLRIAHEMRQEGQFEWARLTQFAHSRILELEKDLENVRTINEILTKKNEE